MTITAAFSSASDAGDSKPADATTQKKAIRKEFEAMSQAMINEQGLLNHAQAATVLEVSTRRIGELVELGIFHRFDFLGRTYVSAREVRERYNQELKAGRPKRSIAKNVGLAVKVVLKTDANQAKQGGFSGPYNRDKEKKASEKQKNGK
jgi:hypothetical protein